VNTGGYYIVADIAGGNTVVHKTNPEAQLTSASTAWAPGDVMKVTAVGHTIQVFRNGALVASVIDGTYTSGRVGFSGVVYSPGVASDLKFDNFVAGNN
jgi:hypothetical protein